MAATCLGSFGAYKLAYSRHKNESVLKTNSNKNSDTVWVTKRYIPTDLRSSAPVPRHKLLAADVKSLPRPGEHWIPPAEPSLRAFYRDGEEQYMYVNQPSTRCEKWSTLRQILPSRGTPYRPNPPNWGTGQSTPPSMIPVIQRRFPHINSPMTRYVDSMHATNRLFKLY